MSKNTIITHNGKFHTDEVFATAIIKYISDDNIEIIRTRDEEFLKKSTADNEIFVIDVGGVYDPGNRNYDHHQKDCREFYSEKYQKSGVFMSSAGMVFKAWAQGYFNMFAYNNNYDMSSLSLESRNYIIDKFYERVIQPIDANDNGISEFEFPNKQKKRFNPLIVQNIVNNKNSDDTNNDETQMKAFLEALELAESTLRDFMTVHLKYHLSYNENKNKLEKYLPDNRELPEIVVLEELFDYYNPLMKFERETGQEGRIKFVILPRDNEKWQIHTIRIPGNGFAHRVSIVSKEIAQKYMNTENVHFVHNSGFIAVVKTREAAMNLAQVSLEEFRKKNEISSIVKIGVGVVGAIYLIKLFREIMN